MSPFLLLIAIPASGVFHMPAGVVAIASELRIPDGAHDLTIDGTGATLRAARDFQGRAMLSCRGCRNITIRGLAFDGDRTALKDPQPLPPSDKSFAEFYDNTGILLEHSARVRVEGVTFRNMPAMALIANASPDVTVARVSVTDSGGRNQRGRNNSTGGVLFEEGCTDFAVLDSTFRRIRGNGVWTHSRYQSPRNKHGRIENNTFEEIGRDAIQVGHATGVMVAHNRGVHIGYPADIVDIEDRAYPVAIDSAGNVDASTYTANHFEEVDGKCIDLDGFHDGAVRGNSCVNGGPPERYPFGHFGVVFNNTSIEMQSRNVVVEDNEFLGMKFGGIFVIGRGHRILRNRMRVNTAHCNDSAARFGCIWKASEPDVLRSGIYLGQGAERPDPARGNTIEGNTITGWGIASHCIVTAPGIPPRANTIRNNTCRDAR